MSRTCRQIRAILNTFKCKYFRNLGAPIKDYPFSVAIAVATIFLTRIPGGSQILAIYLPWGYCGFLRQEFVEVTMNKVNKIREYFKINGLTRTSYYIAYLIDGIIRSSVISLILLIGFILSAIESIHGWNLLLVFIVLELNAISSIFISYTLGVFLNDPFVGSDIIGTTYGLMGFLYFVGISFPSCAYICSLFPPAAMTLSTLGQEENISFKTWHGALMLLGDTVLYFLLFFICDTYYGVDKEFTRRYWSRILCGRNSFSQQIDLDRSLNHPLISDERQDNVQEIPENDYSSALYHEAMNVGSQFRTVQIDNLRKNFGDTEVLRGLSVSMYEKQIFCLLGHNGAGKTTSINILTGFSRADAGQISYFGKDFLKHFDEIKDKIGVCPQTDLCLPYMTCEENLRLLAEIRGIPVEKVHDEIVKQLQKVGLLLDKNKLSSELSGGNRRKLSLAMALMGGTQILYLDEPTSAMDPASRRVIWNIIKELRNQGKTILLTTHYLEEADELADRIGVMSKGILFAVGSPEFIKKKFGVGYHLFLSPKYGHEITNQFEDMKNQLADVVKDIVPAATLVTQTSSDALKFCLPFSSQSKFAELFRTLEKIEGLQLNLGMNSLEDAFLNISIEEGKKDQDGIININQAPASVNKRATYNFWAQLTACFLKRYLITIRSPQGYYAIIQPIAFIITAVVLPYSIQDKNQRLASFCAFLCIGFTASSSIYCGSTVYDREKKTKYALRVMGCKNSAYWLGTFLFDFSIILCFVVFLVALVYICNVEFALVDMTAFVSLTLAFVCSNVTVAYFWGFAYTSSLDATSFYPVVALLVFYFIPFVLQALLGWMKFRESSQGIQVIGFVIGPCVAYQQGLFALNPREDSIDNFIFPPSLIPTPWGYVGILTIQAIAYMALTLVIENHKASVKIIRNKQVVRSEEPKQDFVEYEDAEGEIKRMLDPANQDMIAVKDLQKVYPTGQQAVKGISFGVEKGQIFGLLGPNGAGKSTTFNIITQLIGRSGGEVKLNGRSIDSENKFSIYKDCGVCPQFDSLWDLLTVREHLIIFGKIKGLSGKDLKENVDFFLNILHITQHQNKRSSQLSGGNKRRLCVALASIGAPTMQFMDEPSTGLDPLARVYLWETIKQTLALRNSSIVLTTHSMPEAESLCSKIGIMINGKFVCIGSTSYLKNKYGSGYKITLARGVDFKGSMAQIMKEVCAEAQFLEEDDSELYETYQIPGEYFVFSKAFEILEDFKETGDLSDFSIYHTTLENVFLEFSRYQRQEHEPSRIKRRPRRKSSLQEKLEWEKTRELPLYKEDKDALLKTQRRFSTILESTKELGDDTPTAVKNRISLEEFGV